MLQILAMSTVMCPIHGLQLEGSLQPVEELVPEQCTCYDLHHNNNIIISYETNLTVFLLIIIMQGRSRFDAHSRTLHAVE